MKITILDTTDNQHIGTVIDMPRVGGTVVLGDSEFIVVEIFDHKIVCFNYIIMFE